jgi:Tfp pilus assembly protein PilO
MNLAGREVSQRELVLLGITLLLAVSFGIYWLGKKTGMAGEGSPLEFFTDLEASAERLEATQRSVFDLTQKMQIGKFQLPSTEESAEVLSHIDKVARSSGLNFPSLTANQPRVGKGRKFQTINYHFTTTSDMNALVKFVDEIQKGDYLICLEDWDMKPAEDPKNIVANLTLRSYYGPPGRGKK